MKELAVFEHKSAEETFSTKTPDGAWFYIVGSSVFSRTALVFKVACDGETCSTQRGCKNVLHRKAKLPLFWAASLSIFRSRDEMMLEYFFRNFGVHQSLSQSFRESEWTARLSCEVKWSEVKWSEVKWSGLLSVWDFDVYLETEARHLRSCSVRLG